MLESASVETVYSLSGDVPPVDVPIEADDIGLWPGALTVGSVRLVCSIRKISAGGAVLHVDQPVEIGQRLELELMTGEQLDGIVAWRRGSEVGLRFDTPVDVFAISRPGVSFASPSSAAGCRASRRSARRCWRRRRAPSW